MYEYEFRINIVLPEFKPIYNILQTYHNINTYTIKYIKNFRCKNNTAWEMKKKLRQTMIYHVKSSNWLIFVESKEIPFNKWKKSYYKMFSQHIAFNQHVFNIEHRFEVNIDENAKLYGYKKNFTEFGLAFELEICNNDVKSDTLPVIIHKLDSYINILKLFYNQNVYPYLLTKCIRKPVITIKQSKIKALKSIKYDGIFGHVYSYKNYIHEEWEDGKQYSFPNETLGDGIVYGAERLENDKVILLYVAQVRGLGVYNIYDILLHFLRTILADAPIRYNIQYYYEKEPIKNINVKSDGIIYHTVKNKIYKSKLKNTIDLLYENGFFVTKEGLIECHESNMVNGLVYECDLDLNVIKPRYDRYVSNTPNQIKKIMKCCDKKLKYSLLYEKK